MANIQIKHLLLIFVFVTISIYSSTVVLRQLTNLDLIPKYSDEPKPKRMYLNPEIYFLLHPTIFSDSETCLHNKSESWRMCIFVESAAQNFENRNLIRQTWASVGYLNGGRFQVVFVVGKSDKETQTSIRSEHEKFQDLLQIDVQDTYQSLGNKSFALMQWAVENLSSNVFVTKIDDDVMVDMKNLQQKVFDISRNFETNKWPQFPILCYFNKMEKFVKPIRAKSNKNYISPSLYKWSSFPLFCRGPMYGTRMDTIIDLWTEARNHIILHNVEDVWVTGVLRQALGMPGDMLIPITKNQTVAFHYKGLNEKGKKKQFQTQWEGLFTKLISENYCLNNV